MSSRHRKIDTAKKTTNPAAAANAQRLSTLRLDSGVGSEVVKRVHLTRMADQAAALAKASNFKRLATKPWKSFSGTMLGPSEGA